MNKKSKKGFTIIELLAAVVIVGIIISLAVVVINKYILQGRNTVDSQLEKQLILAAKSYYTDNKAKFITDNDNGVVVWYTTLKAENYMTNDLVDSDGNSCAKSYVVVKKDNTKYSYSGCVLCDNGGYNNTKGKKECSESLKNNIYCEWTDANGNKLDKTYLGVKKNNQVTLKLTCKGRGIKFSKGESSLEVNNMISSKFGSLSRLDYDAPTNNKNEVTSFVSNIKYTTLPNADGNDVVSFKENSAYVLDNVGQKIPNAAAIYDGIVIDGKGPSCSLTGPYKDSGLKTSVKAVKSGTTVYYGLNCKDDNNVNGTIEKSGFASSDSISELNIISRPKNEAKEKSAIISVKVTKGSSSKLKLTYKKDQLHDNYDNGNTEVSSSINGSSSTLVIDDMPPTCTFNGPAHNATFKTRKSALNIVDDVPNDYVYYELKCTDEGGIDLSTFKFSDIKNNGFDRIEQSGNINLVKNNGVLIGYAYYIKAYENPNVVPNTTKATLKYDKSNLSDSVGNKGEGTIESSPVIMIDNNAIPSCNITYSSNNDGSGTLTGVMSDRIGLTKYAWSTEIGEPDQSEYTNISGTSRSVKYNVTDSGTYYLHMINELGLPGYCQLDKKYIVINKPKNPKIDASDRIVSGDWHNQNYTLTAKDSSSGVTYYIGTNESDLNVGTTQSVNYETKGTTYYAKTCWNKNKDVCSETVQYSAKLDKTPPTCTVKKTKYGNVCPEEARGENYKYNYWTQCGVTVEVSNCSDSISGLASDSLTSASENYYTENSHTVTFKNIKDKAGNYYTSGSNKIKIDRTSPEIRWTDLNDNPIADGATVIVGNSIKATCIDDASGAAGFGGIFINGSTTDYGTDIGSEFSKKVTFKTTGTKKLYAACSDGAGNPTYEDKDGSNAVITVIAKRKKYSFSKEDYGSGTCSSGNCCSSSPKECNEDNHGKMQYKDCKAETTTTYNWEQTDEGSSPKAYSGKAGKWCKNNGFKADHAGCDGSGNYCTSSNVGETCRKSSGGSGTIVNCTIYTCKKKEKKTGNYTYGESRKCVYNLVVD